MGAVFLVCLALFQHLHASGGVALLAPSSAAAAAASPPPPPPALTSFFFGGKAASSASVPLSSAPAATDAWLVDYNAALAAIAFMLLLGFADDVLDVPWRVKFFFIYSRRKKSLAHERERKKGSRSLSLSLY